MPTKILVKGTDAAVELLRAYGLMMELPEGKLPGFYAQLIKALAAKAPLLDRDKEMLIFRTLEERQAACSVMQQYKIAWEDAELLQLPENLQARPAFSDYGWVTRSGYPYVYADAVYIFRLAAADADPDAEPGQALLQLEEHLWASFQLGDESAQAYLTDIESKELAERIARAYHCEAKPVPF